MAKYKRQKVKRYRRSFYSRGTRIKKGIGIVVLVLAVLGAAWLAAPHVLDWATHTWYTVVKNRDLEAESASRAAASSEAAASSAVQEAASSQPEPEQPWRLVGEVLNTYLIVEQGDTVLLIDKHAAHERMNFDRLMTSKEPPMRQTLLQPIAVEPGKEDAALLLDNLELLEQFGFGCEDFGDGAILVREVPADLDAADTAATLEELAQKLRSGQSPDEKREALLHTMACKAAIKGGWTSDLAELRVLVEKVQSGEVRYCPHGRPVVVKVSSYSLSGTLSATMPAPA